MKKLIALALLVAFVGTSLVGCGGGATTKPAEKPKTETEKEKEKAKPN